METRLSAAPGRRERKRQDTRRALLDAATRLFSERGIYTTTIEEITEAADLGKGTFYKHFQDREDLLAAVVARGFGRLLEGLDAGLPGDAPWRDLVRALLEGHVRFFRESPEYLLIFHQARGWLKMIEAQDSPLRLQFRDYVEALAGRLARCAEGAALDPEARRRRARVLAGTLAGALSFERVVGGEMPAAAELAAEFGALWGEG